jgi:predicted 3-demethylubiquinone-9 3-methyltransferase (glyoxalase superfamily)
MSKIITFLWFDHEAEAAARFYQGIFSDFKMGEITRFGKDNHGVEGSVMSVNFTLFSQDFAALNGGPDFKPTPAISFLVQCEDQAEVDRYWNALSEGGEQMQCGWVTDKFGITWQITPEILFTLLSDPDPQKAYRTTQAMLKMIKIDIAGLLNAYNAKE